MQQYIEWLQTCLNNIHSFTAEGFNLALYGQALLWQVLFILTLLIPVLFIIAAMCPPALFISSRLKKYKKLILPLFKKYGSKRITNNTIFIYEDKSALKQIRDKVASQINIMINIYAVLLLFLFAPFCLSDVSSHPIQCFLWIICLVVAIIYIANTALYMLETGEPVWANFLIEKVENRIKTPENNYAENPSILWFVRFGKSGFIVIDGPTREWKKNEALEERLRSLLNVPDNLPDNFEECYKVAESSVKKFLS